MYEVPCRAEGNADDVGTGGNPAVESVVLRVGMCVPDVCIGLRRWYKRDNTR